VIKNFVHFYELIRKPGVVIHEISHLLLVLLIPGIHIESIDLTSEIEHSGKYTGTRMFMISYAPLYINVATAYVLIRYSRVLSLDSVLLEYLSIGGLLLMSCSLLLASIPSFIDAKNPIIISYKSVISNPISFALLFTPVILVLSLPFLFITWIIKKSLIVGILVEVLFMLIIFAIGLGYINITSGVEIIINQFELSEISLQS
jgi:hypothetical protein